MERVNNKEGRMQISILSTPAAHARALAKLFAWANHVDLACAWATAGQGNAAHWKLIDIDKIRRAVIGVEFAQTEPWVLRTLLKDDRLRVGVAKGTFHPKVYIGTKGEDVRAIVGSANFTGAAFSSNVELGVIMEGRKCAPHDYRGRRQLIPDNHLRPCFVLFCHSLRRTS